MLKGRTSGLITVIVFLYLGSRSGPLMADVQNGGAAQAKTQPSAERISTDLASIEAETNQLDLWLIRIGILQAVIFVFQLAAFIYQGKKLHETVEEARAEGRDMARSVEHAGRGATAMERVATAMTNNATLMTELLNLQKDVFRKNLRAYVTVQFQGYLPENVAADNRHEVRVLVINAGNTPARAIFTSTRLRVMPVPLPPDMDLTLPLPLTETYAILPSRESFYNRAWLEGFLSDAENADIKSLTGRALYVYGTIRYRDIFDEEHTTTFCNAINWDAAGNANWIAVSGRNAAN